MMIKLNILFFAVLLFVGLTCPAAVSVAVSETSSAVMLSDETPLLAFEKYWAAAKAGDMETVVKMIAEPPSSYWDCYGLTPAECAKRLTEDAAAPKPTGDNVFELEIKRDDTLIRTRVPIGVRRGKWISYKVLKQETFQDEARLTINVKLPDGVMKRDVLLRHIDDAWKIIAILDPEESEHYAKPR